MYITQPIKAQLNPISFSVSSVFSASLVPVVTTPLINLDLPPAAYCTLLVLSRFLKKN